MPASNEACVTFLIFYYVLSCLISKATRLEIEIFVDAVKFRIYGSQQACAMFMRQSSSIVVAAN
jgi:hypothetical protein